jgi:hypothetical protein
MIITKPSKHLSRLIIYALLFTIHISHFTFYFTPASKDKDIRRTVEWYLKLIIYNCKNNVESNVRM